MKRIVSFFSKIDAAFQHRFDSACFFLMRNYGIRKSTIRYVLNGIGVIGIAGIAVHTARIGHFGFAIAIGMLMLVLLVLQHLELYFDKEAESRTDGSLSISDQRKSSGVIKLCGASSLILGPFLMWQLPEHAMGFLGWMMSAITHVLHIYLAKTPMNPPAEKETENVLSPRAASAET